MLPLFSDSEIDDDVSNSEDRSLMDLPPEVRVLILCRLKLCDLRSIRLVSQILRIEVDQGIGLNVILRGSKPWRKWNCTDAWRCLKAMGNPELKRVKHNINWISNCCVRGLNTSQLTGLDFDPLTLIQSPYCLQRFVIQLDEDPAPKKQILEALSAFNNLRTISITCTDPRSKFPYRKPDKYREFCIEFCKDVLTTLVTKPKLKEFSIIVNIRQSPFAEFKRFLGRCAESERANPEYPSALTSLKIQAPIYQNLQDWVTWKALLDRQTQLRDLSVNIGFPHWSYFETVIRNNMNTLSTLDIVMSNWARPRPPVAWSPQPDQVFQLNEMDWTNLLPNPENLTSLKVIMSSQRLPTLEINPAATLNFAQLQLTHLDTLDLRGIHLGQLEFFVIFRNLPVLRELRLIFFSSLFFETEIMTQAGELLYNALTKNRLERVEFIDFSVQNCPLELRQRISNLPNFKTTWSSRIARALGLGFYMSIIRIVHVV